MTSIIGFLTILIKESHGPLNEKQKKFLDILIVNSNILKKLIHDLMLLSLIHTNDFKFNQSTFNLNDAINQMLDNQHSIINKKLNSFSVEFQSNNMQLYADKEKIIQLLSNLILNSNKYTENGTIHCEVSQTDTFTTFIIKDSGNGLTDAQKTQLLTAFDHQFDESQFSNEFGIELAVVKVLLELHRGQIFIESKLDKGSIFTVVIPHSNHIATEQYQSDHLIAHPS